MNFVLFFWNLPAFLFKSPRFKKTTKLFGITRKSPRGHSETQIFDRLISFHHWWNARIPKWICQTPNHDFLKSYQTQFGVWICHKNAFFSPLWKWCMLPGANIVKSNLEFEYAIKMLFCHKNISIMPKIIIIKSNLELWMCFKIAE